MGNRWGGFVSQVERDRRTLDSSSGEKGIWVDPGRDDDRPKWWHDCVRLAARRSVCPDLRAAAQLEFLNISRRRRASEMPAFAGFAVPIARWRVYSAILEIPNHSQVRTADREPVCLYTECLRYSRRYRVRVVQSRPRNHKLGRWHSWHRPQLVAHRSIRALRADQLVPAGSGRRTSPASP